MAKVKTKDTKPEILLRQYLFKLGFRYRKHKSELPGKPDICFPKLKKVIFVNGCFWHGHSCKKGCLPKSNRDFWTTKIEKNKVRDISNNKKLLLVGWESYTFWECQLKNSTELNSLVMWLDASGKTE